MQSPARANRLGTAGVTVAPADTANTQDYVLMKHKMQMREEEVLSLHRTHEAERQRFVQSNEGLSKAVDTAQDTLTQKQRIVDDANREIALMAVAREKGVSSKCVRREQLDTEAQEYREQMSIKDREVHILEDDCQAARKRLAHAQLTVETSRKQVAMLESQHAEKQHASEVLDSQLRANQEAHQVEQAKQLARARDSESATAQLLEGIAMHSLASNVAEKKHKEKMAAGQRQLESQQSEISELRTQMEAARALLRDHAEAEEEQAKRYRHNEEEAVCEHAAARKLDLAKRLAEREEFERTFRSDMEAAAGAVRAQIAQAASQIVTVRSMTNQMLDQEFAFRQNLCQQRQKLVGFEAVREGVAFNERRLSETEHAVTDICGANDAARRILADHEETLENLRAATAPLPDVISSVEQRKLHVEQYREAIADAEANCAVQRVKQAERRESAIANTKKLKEVAEKAQLHKENVKTETENVTAALQGQARVLEAEMATIQTRLAEMTTRNASLDTTLAGIAKERKAILEQLQMRREVAMQAAAQLMASLQ